MEEEEEGVDEGGFELREVFQADEFFFSISAEDVEEVGFSYADVSDEEDVDAAVDAVEDAPDGVFSTCSGGIGRKGIYEGRVLYGKEALLAFCPPTVACGHGGNMGPQALHIEVGVDEGGGIFFMT